MDPYGQLKGGNSIDFPLAIVKESKLHVSFVGYYFKGIINDTIIGKLFIFFCSRCTSVAKEKLYNATSLKHNEETIYMPINVQHTDLKSILLILFSDFQDFSYYVPWHV